MVCLFFWLGMFVVSSVSAATFMWTLKELQLLAPACASYFFIHEVAAWLENVSHSKTCFLLLYFGFHHADVSSNVHFPSDLVLFT